MFWKGGGLIRRDPGLMPPPNLNLVTLIGTLAGTPSVTQVDRTRVVSLDLATMHGDERRLHRVVVADEFLGRELGERLRQGTGIHVLGELAYDAAGAHVLVAGRRGSDVYLISGEAAADRPTPVRAAAPGQATAAPLPSPVPQPPAVQRQPGPAGGFGGLANLAGLDDSPRGEDEDDAPEQAQSARSAPPPAQVAPRTVAGARPTPAGSQPGGPSASASGPVPRTLPGARPTVAPPPPVPSPHAIHQPKPTQPPLRPAGQAPRKDAFAQQPDDGDIPF